MKTFHNKSELKQMLLEEVKKHRDADEIVQGVYEENGKFCAVGCSIESLNVRLGKKYKHSDHSAYETELGIPRIIARLEDKIFEGLTKEECKDFPLRFVEAVPVGADLSLVWPQFAVWILTDEKYGVIKHANTNKQKATIQKVANLYTQVINGTPINDLKKEFSAAAAAYADAYAAAADADADAYAAAAAAADAAAADAYAAAAAAAAADAYAYAAAAAAAAAYAYAYAYAAAYADAYAYAAAAAADARTEFYSECAKKLLELIASCH